MDGRLRKQLKEDIEAWKKIKEMKKILLSIPEEKLSTKSRFIIKQELEEVEYYLKGVIDLQRD